MIKGPNVQITYIGVYKVFFAAISLYSAGGHCWRRNRQGKTQVWSCINEVAVFCFTVVPKRRLVAFRQSFAAPSHCPWSYKVGYTCMIFPQIHHDASKIQSYDTIVRPAPWTIVSAIRWVATGITTHLTYRILHFRSYTWNNHVV